ncbi:hypothetical protein ACIF8T_19765 [Streptomyces sp. NPDC085946]|uniref:hypothetical protein n=1 Tax=Streptomyces sp. NPDC085946 TaxID=3365744 RepID=UPI0037D1D232
MRGTVRRSGTAGLLTAVLLAGLSGCTGEAGDAAACTDGTYAWSGVRRTQQLTALTDPLVFETRTDSYSAALKPFGDTVHRPRVTGAPRGVGAAAVIEALGRRVRAEVPLAGPGETDRPEDDHYFEVATGDLEGAYYGWGSIDLVEAAFTYTCPGAEPARGHVRTWEHTGSGFLSCSEPSGEPAGRAAALRRCPAGSVAAEDAV